MKKIVDILEKYNIDEYHWKLEIAAEIEAITYPKEFVKWLYLNQDQRRLVSDEKGIRLITTDELYQYWLNNTKK